MSWNVSPDGRRLAVSAFRIRRLYDAETGRELAALPGPGWGEFLADGRWLAAAGGPGGLVARLYRPDGTEVRSFRLPAGTRPQGEAAPGLVVLQRWSDVSPQQKDAAVFLLDLATGRVQPLERGVWSAVANIAPRIGPQSIASRLFVRGERELLLLDPATGGLKPVSFR